jgi:hypothetical protein
MFLSKKFLATTITSLFALATTAAQAGTFDKAGEAFKLGKDAETTGETMNKDAKGLFKKTDKTTTTSTTTTPTATTTSTSTTDTTTTAPAQ